MVYARGLWRGVLLHHRRPRQVAGQAENVTLLECIESGAVPFPGRMSYVQWLKWR